MTGTYFLILRKKKEGKKEKKTKQNDCHYGRNFQRNGAPVERKGTRAWTTYLKLPPGDLVLINVHIVRKTGIGKRA